MQLKHTITCGLLLAFTSTYFQTVSINRIQERRSTSDGFFGNQCEIEIKVTGDEVRKYKHVKIHKILNVVDEQGLNLIKEDNNYKYEEIDTDARAKFETKVPSRKSTFIKQISGEIVLYNPTNENGAIVKIADYQNKTNTNLLPSTSGVQLVYLTKESVEKNAKDQKVKREEELKNLPEASRVMAEVIGQAFGGLSNFSDSPNRLTFLIQGDKSKFVDVYFEDEKGQKIKSNGYSKMNNLFSYSFREKPNPNWKLVLNIETSASVKIVPFNLTNVELP